MTVSRVCAARVNDIEGNGTNLRFVMFHSMMKKIWFNLMKIWLCQFFAITLPNFFKRFASKTQFSANPICKKFEAKNDNQNFCLKFTNFASIYQSLCAPIASNVRAAWRSGGLHYRLCGLQTFIFALPFLRAYCRRCAKPPVVGRPLFPSFPFFGVVTFSW